MSRRNVSRALAVVGLLALAVAVPALAATRAPSKRTIVIKGGESFKPNRYIKDTMRYSPGKNVIRKGGRVTIRNRTAYDHTLSLVKRSEVPRTTRQIDFCLDAVCGRIFRAHGASDTSPPTTRLVNVGAPGFDQAGDSVLIPPKGKVQIAVTAKRGATRRFICAFHPWMQGRFVVG